MANEPRDSDLVPGSILQRDTVDDPGELMDSPTISVREMRAVMDDLERINNYFGGFNSILGSLGVELRRCPGPLSILDVGTGDGALLRRIARHFGGRCDLRFAGVDIHPVSLEVARERCSGIPRLMLLRGDALCLPFADRSFDFAVSQLTLHHLGGDGAVRAIAELDRVTRRGFYISDLVRSLVAFGLTRATLKFIGTHSVTQHDGPVSVLRSPSWKQYRALVRNSMVSDLHVRQTFPFRVLIWKLHRRSGSGADGTTDRGVNQLRWNQ